MHATNMRAIVLEEGQYSFRECAKPSPGPDEVLIKVAYSGVNRADVFQKQRRYPLPERTPAIPGMEISGTIEACGKNIRHLQSGEAVCALVSEGAFSEYAVAPASLVFSIKDNLNMPQAAALPEACFTAWISLVVQAKLTSGEAVLIHGGASGIGTIAIQIAKLLGARVFATAGSKEKCVICEKLGAEAINYKEDDFAQVIKNATHDRGVDVIMDMVGGDYFARNLECLSHAGRLSIIAFLKGSTITANLAPILLKHLSIMGSTLRSRPLAEKEAVALDLQKHVWPAVLSGHVKPVIDRLFPLAEAEKALERMDQGLNVGKILLKI